MRNHSYRNPHTRRQQEVNFLSNEFQQNEVSMERMTWFWGFLIIRMRIRIPLGYTCNIPLYCWKICSWFCSLFTAIPHLKCNCIELDNCIKLNFTLNLTWSPSIFYQFWNFKRRGWSRAAATFKLQQPYINLWKGIEAWEKAWWNR